MCQRSDVKKMVMQLHEKNLVLINILRDIVENETTVSVNSDATEGETARSVADRATRRTEILGEIRYVLLQEDVARRVQA